MINSIVAPLITNATLYPNPTNAATNYRNQSTAQFEVLRASVNTELQKLNSVTDGSSGADQIKMTPIAVTGASNTVQSVTEALAVGYVPYATAASDGTNLTATITGITEYTDGLGVCILCGGTTTGNITLDINSIGAKYVCYFPMTTSAYQSAEIVTQIIGNQILTLRYSASQEFWYVQ